MRELLNDPVRFAAAKAILQKAIAKQLPPTFVVSTNTYGTATHNQFTSIATAPGAKNEP